jgi:hypothetical protein
MRSILPAVVLVTALGPVAAAQKSPALPPPRRVIEAERLIETALATQGGLMHQDMTEFGPDWGGNAQLWWYATKPHAILRLAPTVLLAGRYDVYVVFTKAHDYGRISVRLDSTPPAIVDLYAGTIRPERVRIVTAVLATGRHQLSLEIIGKNELADGHTVGIDRIEFVPVKPVIPLSL